MTAVERSEVVVLGVKPHVVPVVAAGLKDRGSGQLLVSVAAGLDTARLAEMFGSEWRHVRAMPNTAVTVGEGATVYCLGPGADNTDSDLVTRLFSSVGLCRRVEESQIGEVVVRLWLWLTSLILLRRGDGSVRQWPRLHVSHTGSHG